MWEEKTSAEEVPPLDWPVSVSVGASCSLLIDEGGSSQVWVADRCNDISFVF